MPKFHKVLMKLLSIIIFYVEKHFQYIIISLSRGSIIFEPLPWEDHPTPYAKHTHTQGMLHVLMFSAFLSLFLGTYYPVLLVLYTMYWPKKIVGFILAVLLQTHLENYKKLDAQKNLTPYFTLQWTLKH